MASSKDNKLLKWIFILSVVLNVATGFYFAKKLYNKSSSKPATQAVNVSYDYDRDKVFEVLPKDSNAIVFLGNSLTQFFELNEFFQNPRVKNRGIQGDKIPGVMGRLSPIISIRPKKIFIEIGLNDLEKNVPVPELLKNYEKLIDTLKAGCPQTKIYIQSLFPVSNKSETKPSYCSPEMNKKIIDVNVPLRNLAKSKQCTYIDVHSQMVLNDEINPVYTFEGLHLSAEGYVKWTEILKPYVME